MSSFSSGAGAGRAVLLLTVWDTERDAEEFERALAESSVPGKWHRGGRRVAIVAGAADKRVDRVLGRMLRDGTQ